MTKLLYIPTAEYVWFIPDDVYDHNFTHIIEDSYFNDWPIEKLLTNIVENECFCLNLSYETENLPRSRELFEVIYD